jgi:hypothetical protein
MQEIMIYIRASILSVELSFVVFCGMFASGMEMIEAICNSLWVYLMIYLMTLSGIEEGRKMYDKRRKNRSHHAAHRR